MNLNQDKNFYSNTRAEHLLNLSIVSLNQFEREDLIEYVKELRFELEIALSHLNALSTLQHCTCNCEQNKNTN